MNVWEIIQSLQKKKETHSASIAFDKGFDCGIDNAINLLGELEEKIERMIDGETEYSRAKKVLVEVLGEERTI